ncbi:diacylglycerol/polyprenol kinase family protein [Leptolyngbya sp. 7M]|uniref:diacylglycerol/polyprenol kinase family protein n=1 Tax=Leptolyngbya sp. 7M TaxID=2812896 RepID=UPI001B8D8B11|nr:diacylglycerol/polyprenol kinase family protein [Leptolyngbya sp. 7M]QYO62673.1 SEC59/DGK1/VTE5 family protein [Leptolyngbya sp. 7M]
MTQLTEPTLWLQIGIAALWVGFVVLVAFGLRYWKLVDAEVIRKVVHIGAGNVILFAWWLGIPAAVGIGASILFSAITLLSYRFPLLPGIDSVGRKSLGTFFYAISIGVLIACFWQNAPHIAVLGVLIMTWGDGLAALIGQHWGQHRYKLGGMQKSWEGSLAMLLVSWIISSLILLSVYGSSWQVWAVALVVAGVAASLEAFSNLGIDNLTVPLGSAGVAFWLSQMLLAV